MKNILVTGASRGIGLEIIKYLLTNEYFILAVSRKISAELNSLVKKYPDKLKYKLVDLSYPNEIKKEIFSDFISYKIPLDGYVNNAALAYDDLITNLNQEKLENMFRVNVFSPFQIVKNVIRNMIYNNTSGSIIHISSISVHTGYKGLAMYAATKGALEAFSKNTAREWGGKGIRSNCIVAGFMETEMTSVLTSAQRERIYNRTSLKRPTSKKSISSMVEYLMSANSNSITGQNIFIDSGTI